MPPALTFRFVLDGDHWMERLDLTVNTNTDHEFAESQIAFSHVVSRFLHGYDNFRLERSKRAPEAVPRNTQVVPYDVIIIGSGMGDQLPGRRSRTFRQHSRLRTFIWFRTECFLPLCRFSFFRSTGKGG
jgi:hypothetical protein